MMGMFDDSHQRENGSGAIGPPDRRWLTARKGKPMYKNIKISVEVIRASHTHQVPQVGCPKAIR